jgi:HAE1 family hydrophobic/amphiphilic exporter-1
MKINSILLLLLTIISAIAIAVVGGLISSTFVTLLVIPVLYSLVMRKRTR